MFPFKSNTNRAVYAGRYDLISTSLKIGMESDRDYRVVWKRLHNSQVMDMRARDLMDMLLHNKLPVRERLFRVRIKIQSSCQRTVETWSWVKDS